MNKKTIIFFIFIAAAVLCIPHVVQGQSADITNWVSLLTDNSPSQALKRQQAFFQIEKQDTASILRTAGELEKATTGGSKRTQLIGKATKAKLLFYYQRPQDSAYAAEMKQALITASAMDESYLEAEYSRSYAEMLYSLNKKALAVQYSMSSLKIHEYLGVEHFPSVSSFYMATGEMLYVTRNEKDALEYLLRGLELTDTETVPYFQKIFTYNNLGLAYKALGKYDSGLYYYQKCMDFSRANNRPDWYETSDLNRFECYIGLQQYDSALLIARRQLDIGLVQKDEYSETVGLWMVGVALFNQKEYNKSLPYIHQCKKLAEKLDFKVMFKVNKILADCYEALGQPEKAYPYLKFFKQINDSMEAVKAQASGIYLHTKAAYDEEQFKRKSLEAKRKRQVNIRNISIIAVTLLAALALWWLNKKRRRARHMQQQAEAQLMDFKDDILSKNDKIETLLAEIHEKQDKQQHAEQVAELSRQMILTEDDWLQFKSLFEKSHPGFLSTLRQKASGITEAELRMATLIKIQLNTKQMAAMQGISTESIHKNRQRLRQRLSLASSEELESYLNTV